MMFSCQAGGPVGNGISRFAGNRRVAFTLIEVMLAITIFSLVMVAVYSSWNSVVRGSKVGLNAAAAAQRDRVAVRALEDALMTAQMFMANADYYAFVADTSDPTFASLSFVSRLPASFPGSGLFGNQPVRRVTFSIEPGPEGGNELVLRQQTLLDASEAEPYPIVLSRNVQAFGVEFWDEQAGEWLAEHVATNQLPALVRVYLLTGEKDSQRAAGVAMRTVSLPNMAIPPGLQAPVPTAAGRGRQPRPGEQPPEGSQ